MLALCWWTGAWLAPRLLPRKGEGRGHDRLTCAEQVNEDCAGVEPTQARGVDDAREDLLCRGTAQ
jgi:hypothetical protein